MGTLENRRKLTAVRGMGAALVGFAGWIVLYVVFGLIEPNIFTTNNMLNLLRSMAKYLLVGVGQGVILITGNIDLSIGSVVAMSAMISATMMSHGTAAIVAVCAAIVCCLAVGVINGLLVGKFKLPPFIATLGTQTIIYGISLVFTDAQPIGGFQESYNDGDLIACFDANIPESVVKEIAKRKPLRAVFRDSGFASSPEKINVFEIFKLYMPEDANDITKRVRVI